MSEALDRIVASLRAESQAATERLASAETIARHVQEIRRSVNHLIAVLDSQKARGLQIMDSVWPGMVSELVAIDILEHEVYRLQKSLAAMDK